MNRQFLWGLILGALAAYAFYYMRMAKTNGAKVGP